MDRHHQRRGGRHEYRGEILKEVEGELWIQCDVDDMRIGEQQECIAVGRRALYRLNPDRPIATTTILDHDLLLPSVG